MEELCVLSNDYELHLVGGKDKRYLSNADINKLKKDEIVEKLKELKLNHRGNKEEVSKRLKHYYKRRREIDKAAAQRSANPPARDRFYDYLCVIDFEATCQGTDNFGYPHEIIEFPAVLLKTTTAEVVDEFHSFCKPLINPTLTPFCSGLTGITQEQVDNAPPFSEVLDNFMAFLNKHELGTRYRFAFLTDGPWDFGQFLQLQCQHCSIPIPHFMRYWINLRRSYCRAFAQQRTSLKKMLEDLGMEFSGRQHSGLDDARNIARVTAHLLEDGHDLRVNERLLRRDRLEAAGKEPSPVRDGNESIDSKDGEDRDELDSNVLSLFSATSGARKKNGASTSVSTVPTRVRSLPYKVLTVSKQEFIHDKYEECLTCGEEDGPEAKE